MRTADALGICGNRQEWKDRGDTDDLEKSLSQRKGENCSKFSPAVRSGEKKNAPD
jgi:hypothetical protein